MSSNKFHTIEIKIPKFMLSLTEQENLTLVPSLTKIANISRRNKIYSFIVISSNENKPHITDDGIEKPHMMK